MSLLTIKNPAPPEVLGMSPVKSGNANGLFFEVYYCNSMDLFKVVEYPKFSRKMIFQDQDGNIFNYFCDEEKCRLKTSEINKGSIVGFVISGKNYAFTKFQFKGSKPVPPNVFEIFPSEEDKKKLLSLT